LVLEFVCYLISGTNMVKDLVLEQKKGFWSMVKERKDLEHDLGLIETKNMKILCKNIRHGRV